MARPTKYRKEMCDTVVEMMAEGASKTEVCAELDICHDTLLEWEDRHVEFSEAIKRGIKLSQAWWERQGRLSLKDKEFSYTGWYMNMKNRFGWADKQELTGKDGGPVEVKGIEVAFVKGKG